MDPFHLIHLETSEDADLGGGGEPSADAGAEPAAEPAADAPATDEPWNLTREDWETQQGAIVQLAEYVASLAGDEGEGDEEYEEGEAIDPEDFDPFNPEHMGALIQQQIAPLASYIQGQQFEAGNEQVEAALTEIAPDLSDESRGIAHQLADAAYVQAGGERSGIDPRAALKHGVDTVRQIEKAAGEKAVEAYKAELAGLASAPVETAAAGGATDILQSPVDEAEAALRFVQRRHQA